MNNIFNEYPERISKNLVLCSINFTVDSCTNTSTIRRGIFKKIETKRRRCADYIGSDSNVTTQVWVTFQFVITIALSVITDHLICTECLCLFYLNHISSHLWGMYAVKHTELVANHSSGRLLLSLQSATPIQTERSDEGVKNRTENSLF